ncbi:podocan-like 1 [Cricetulus griseus]
MLRWTEAHMEDLAFPHLGDSSQPLSRACPWRCSCPRDDTVDCAGLGLRVFPDNITRAARHLSLQNNQLQELPYNELSRLSGLCTLDLHSNLISSEGLPDEAFESLTQLEHFYVAHNKVSMYVALRRCIPAGSLSVRDLGVGAGEAGNPHRDQMLLLLQLSVAPQFLPRTLRVADLAANEVVEIFPLTFGEKPALRKLSSLEYLDLSHNQLATVPEGLPRTLTILHLGRNCIRQVEAGRLHRARGLRYLLLPHNELGASALPAGTLRPLRALHTLHLYGNRLERVPPALPRHLKALVMPHNRVAVLGARDLVSARTLVELNLAYNRLASAHVHPGAFRRLRVLRSLDLAGNQLSRLPEGLPASLRSLRLQRNQLRGLEPELLAGLNRLQELSLAHNRLRVGDIGPGTWHELQALQVLDLSHNELSFVPPDLPEALEELYLQANRISHVGPEAFLSTPRLRALFLRANRLHMTSIPAETFLGLAHLRVVDTAENPEQVLVQLPPKDRGP